MKLALIIATIVNLASCTANMAMIYSNLRITQYVEFTSQDISNSWQANQAYLQRLGVALGQIERDLIRIRAKAQRGGSK